MFNSIELAVFTGRLTALCEEMGYVLQRSALSPNIKDRLDFSCAFFDATGRMSAQAAHIPVHLGSMAFAMERIVGSFKWREGDMVVFNDPFMGGTHLPDVTLVAPFFYDDKLIGFVANRAHHANIGAEAAGSMPLSSSLQEEGLLISPVKLLNNGQWNRELVTRLSALSTAGAQCQSAVVPGDFLAQVSANQAGIHRLKEWLAEQQGGSRYLAKGLQALDSYGARVARESLRNIARGQGCYQDVMDDDGFGSHDVVISVCAQQGDDGLCFDFTGTADEVAGNINCPLSVTAAAVYYAVLCLLPDYVPHCAGVFDQIHIRAPQGCLVNANPGRAVAAGNVETSMRIVDVVLGALASLGADVPANSQGTMNNLAMGSSASAGRWDYYETMAGGMGAGSSGPGLSGVQCHMTNTLNTPIESLEVHYPVRVERYALRRGSEGDGLHRGGCGLVRELRFLEVAEVTLLSERRSHSPRGGNGGGEAMPGVNYLNGKPLAAKYTGSVKSGDLLRIESPGGGGWGKDAGCKA